MPIERMLRTIWPGDSSKAKYRQRLAAPAGGVGEVRGEAGLAGARRAGHQDACCRGSSPAPPSMASSRGTPVEIRSSLASCCKPSEVIGRTLMPSSSIRNGYSLVPCVGAAVLDDAQPPRRDLVDHAVVEQDHAVGDVLFQAVPGQRALAALAGDDGGDALVLEPAEQAAQLGPQDARCSTGR